MKHALLTICLVLTITGVCSAQSFTYYYPHVTTGGYDGGSWQTAIFITNPTEGFASGTVTFTQSDGAPFFIPFIDEGGIPVGAGNLIEFVIEPGQTRKFISVTNMPMASGFATVHADAAVMGTAVFSHYDAWGGLIGEAAVPAAIPLGRQAVLVDTTNGYKTGVAIANPNPAPLHITFELLDTAGQRIGINVVDLIPHGHMAFFIHEMFPEAPEMVGRLQFWCRNPMTAVALRFDPSFTMFTTMPPIAIAGLMQFDMPPAAILPRRDELAYPA